MSRLQRLITALVPRSWAASMEAESRAWKLRCACGNEQSIWELGGIRWKATGNKRVYRRCPDCGQLSWQTVEYRPATPSSDSADAANTPR